MTRRRWLSILAIGFVAAVLAISLENVWWQIAAALSGMLLANALSWYWERKEG